ncbi:DUF1572 domain-containing protein [Algibacter amylolyticus]|uniref:DUF1572 domain-containing protein n=1 Tax=Algibacter amylolyticus TaxID=1608400 RepID=A0A5M7B8G8_9FLAO|nr:DUF1572 family protein [Algibacter amylolyticus]KAA5823655.1 DUF1572 domain-containing protein [Algibacter amylolyticus]MBB5267818.1 hypothetical protein [Algibacter amylolyticus]TSJ74143.1 DUF1572 domain-containing protein [Algibacter amylolyticus]
MESYLESVNKQFEYYKSLGDKTFKQLSFDDMLWQSDEDANSIAILVKHIAGNMRSRWSNFLTEDGEKSWRNRDDEFVSDFTSEEAVIATWESGWFCLFNAIRALKPEDLEHIIYIRNGGHTVTEAINRQLAHYAYHVGQIVFLGKLLKGKEWKSLSIPKGNSATYNKAKFNNEKERRHFTDDL